MGVTTEEIDRVVHEACIERECYPSPLNYHNFPNSCCTSVNEVICHGIPDLRPLEVSHDHFLTKQNFLWKLNRLFCIPKYLKIQDMFYITCSVAKIIVV